jgi:hypothetical protein
LKTAAIKDAGNIEKKSNSNNEYPKEMRATKKSRANKHAKIAVSTLFFTTFFTTIHTRVEEKTIINPIHRPKHMNAPPVPRDSLCSSGIGNIIIDKMIHIRLTAIKKVINFKLDLYSLI